MNSYFTFRDSAKFEQRSYIMELIRDFSDEEETCEADCDEADVSRFFKINPKNNEYRRDCQ